MVNSWRRGYKIFLFLMFTGSVILVCLYQFHVRFMPINTVQIIGPLRLVTEKEVSDLLINSNIRDKSFFSIDMQEIKTALNKSPWIYNISLTKVWPDKFRIRFEEDVPLAYLKNQGIITQRDCKLVKPSNSLKNALKENGYFIGNRKGVNNNKTMLPTLVGDKKKSKKLCDTLAKLQKSVKPIDSRIKKLVMSQRNSVHFELDNGLIVFLGKQELDKRIRRFVDSYNKLKDSYFKNSKDDDMKLLYVDLRYHNGLAVGKKMEQNLIELMETA